MKNKLLSLILFLGSYAAYSQVGIGTPMPSASAQLEVVASDKGVLIPRITLTGTTDATTITSGNVTSLLVFNTASVSDVKPGYYYWYDNKWNRIVISNEITASPGTVIFNPTTQQFTYVDGSGTTQNIDINSIVKASETLTTLVNNGAGSYTYTNEGGTTSNIDVVGDVITNASTILNNPAFKTEITQVIKTEETVTALVNNGGGSYTYTNEAGTPVNIDVVGDVTSNFSTIVSNPAVTNLIENIVNTTTDNVTFDATTNQFSYVDATGTTQLVDISTIVKANETVTTLDKDAANNGKYVYKNETNTPTTIDVVGDVITNASTILNDPSFKTEITQVIKTEETVTTLVNNGGGSYTYTNEAGTPVNIDVVGDVTSNFSTIVNDPAVTNLIENIVNTTAGNVTFDAATNQFTYTDATGTTQVVDINTIVKANETQTTLVNNGGGSYTYTNEAGTPVNIEVVGDVTSNFSTIVNDPAVTNIIENIVNKTEGNVTFDAATNQFSYVDATGTTQVVDISTIVKANETLTTLAKDAANNGKYVYTSENATATTIDVVGDVITNASTILNDPAFTTELTNVIKTNETLTTLVNNGAGSYTYTNEAGTAVNIEVVGDVTSNFSTIVNDPAVTTIIENIVNKTEGNVTFDAATNQFSYVDATGTTQVVDISTIVKANETLTTLVKNAANNGTYLYTSENATGTTIDVVGDVITNASTILNNPAFTTELTNVIKANETLTTLINNGAGSYTYTNEAGTPVNIEVVGDVTSNFSTIANDPAVTTIIQNIASKTVGAVTFDSTTNQFSYTDATGTKQVIDISTIVKANETITTLVKNAANNGTYLYTSENATPTTIDVVGDVITNASTILNNPAFTTDLTTIIKANEKLTTLVNNGAGSYTYTNEAGTPVNIEVVGDVTSNFSTIANNPAVTTIIQNIASKTVGAVTFDSTTNQFSYTDATGTKQLIDISTIVKANETITTLVKNAANNGTYLYTSENATPTTIDVVTDVITNASTILNNPSFKTDLTNVIKAEETITTLVKNAANNGTYLYTSENATPTTIDVVGDVITNASTILNNPAFTTDLTTIIKANETLTTQAQNVTTGAITYTNEAGTPVVSQVVSANAGNLVTVGTDGGSLLTPAAIATATTVSNASAVNTSTVTVNGVTSTGAPIINSNANSLTGASLTTTVNGVASTPLDLTPAIAAGQTITTLVKNAANNGTYLYTSENATPTTIDVVGDVISNASTILNDPSFKTDLTTVIKANETITTQAQNVTTGAITYTNEAGTPVVSQVVSANAGNLVTVGTDGGALLTAAAITTPTTVSNTSVVNSLTTTVNGVAAAAVPIVNSNITALTGSTLTTTVNGVASTALDLAPAIAAAQTVTTQAQNLTTGAITYTNEAGTAVTSQVVSADAGNLVKVGTDGGSLLTATDITAATTVSNASAINTGTVTVNGVTSLGAPIINTNATSLTGANLTTTINGVASTPLDLGPAIKAGETLTSLTDVVTQVTDEFGAIHDVHTLTYTDEASVANPIDLSVLVKGTETLTALTYDGTNLTYQDEVGNSTAFKLTDLVGEAQTLTTLQVNLATGTLDYKDENGTTNAIDLSAAVKEPWFGVSTGVGATLNTENIYTNGWVGIGYTTPSAAPNEKLRVNGAISTVNSYYADYVFEDYFKGFSEIKADYKFKRLSEVEDYIKKNKHLPGITPINELEKTKEGYSFNMSELSIQLLEKTEEIYLHIIEQNKEIEAKDKEIKELKEASASMNQRLEKLEKLILEKK
jgi:hypothetical protein